MSIMWNKWSYRDGRAYSRHIGSDCAHLYSQSCESNSYIQPGRQLANKHHSNSLFLLPWFIVSIQHIQVRCTHSRIEAMALASWLVLRGAERHVRCPLSGLQVVEKGAEKERH